MGRGDAAYDSSYVRPDSWAVDVDACSSSGGGATISGYDVSVRSLAGDLIRATHGPACRRRLRVPKLGRYDVSVAVRAGGRTSAPRVERIAVRDWLVVSLGDSMASGEGAPDQPGEFSVDFPRTPGQLMALLGGQLLPAVTSYEPVRWQDRRAIAPLARAMRSPPRRSSATTRIRR